MGEKSDDAEYGLYFAPRDYNKIALVYNKELFKKFGVEAPDTTAGWDMDAFLRFVQEVADKIKAKGPAFSAYKAARLFLQWEPVYTTVFNAEADNIIVNGKLNLSQNNLDYFTTLYDELYSYDNASQYSDTFKQGTVCMDVICRSDFLNIVNTLTDENGNCIVDFLPFPAEEIGTGCSGYAITKAHAEETQTVNGVTKTSKELCWDFIKFILSEEGQELAGATGLLQPVLQSLEETGSWRTAISKDLNHDAFRAGRELGLRLYDDIDPVDRTSLRGALSFFFETLANKTEGADDGHRAANMQVLIDAFKNRGAY